MSTSGRWTMAAVLAAGLAAWLAGSGALRAQARRGTATPRYQYVGVEQTIARIDLEAGRVEILAKRGDPRASLLIRDPRPWEWRDVPVRERRPAGRIGSDETDPEATEHRPADADDRSP